MKQSKEVESDWVGRGRQKLLYTEYGQRSEEVRNELRPEWGEEDRPVKSNLIKGLKGKNKLRPHDNGEMATRGRILEGMEICQLESNAHS